MAKWYWSANLFRYIFFSIVIWYIALLLLITCISYICLVYLRREMIFSIDSAFVLLDTWYMSFFFKLYCTVSLSFYISVYIMTNIDFFDLNHVLNTQYPIHVIFSLYRIVLNFCYTVCYIDCVHFCVFIVADHTFLMQ